MARKRNRQEMSGLFDFFSKKKKGPEQQSLFALPPSSNLPTQYPAEKRSPFSILAPKSQLPGKAEPRKPSPFSIFAPKQEEVRERPASAPSRPPIQFPQATEETGEVKEIFKVLTPPAAPAAKNPNRYIFVRPSAPPERIPLRPYGLPAPVAAPVTEWTMPLPSQLAEHFRSKMNLPGMWDMIRETRAMPGFREEQLENFQKGVPMFVRVDPVVYQEFYTDFANFYGIPWDVMARYLDVAPIHQKEAEESLWNNVISPLNSMVPEAFEILKPPDLPGFFNVSFTEPSGEYWLYYIEPMFEDQAGGPGGS